MELVFNISLHPKKQKNSCLFFNERKAGNSELIRAPSRTSRLTGIA